MSDRDTEIRQLEFEIDFLRDEIVRLKNLLSPRKKLLAHLQATAPKLENADERQAAAALHPARRPSRRAPLPAIQHHAHPA